MIYQGSLKYEFSWGYLLVFLNQIMPITATTTAAMAAIGLILCSAAYVSVKSATRVMSEIMIINVLATIVLWLKFNIDLLELISVLK
jgi:hypothetical protein